MGFTDGLGRYIYTRASPRSSGTFLGYLFLISFVGIGFTYYAITLCEIVTAPTPQLSMFTMSSILAF